MEIQTELKTDFEINIENKKNIFLYSAMLRIGDLSLTEEFFKIDPVNLSMPIILSSKTDIKLRIKAAHFAFKNNLIGIDSLGALYQTVDFTYEELNNPSKVIELFQDETELGMAYFYQLINIQLLPITRLEAILKFWEFAEENNHEKVAYTISLKSLNTISPSSDLTNYGPKIAKAYIIGNDLLSAQKWILFSENLQDDFDLIYDYNSTKLLYDLNSIQDQEDLPSVLIKNFEHMNESLLNNKNKDLLAKSEILNLIFSSLNEQNTNIFKIEKKINEERSMPSLYLLDLIRKSANDSKAVTLLLSVILSIDDKKWSEVHPEHLRLILLSLKKYKESNLLNNILLEVLKNNQII